MIKDNAPIHYDYSEKPIIDDWRWEVQPIAFRVAAGILLANLLLSAVGLLAGQVPNAITAVIDLALAIALLRLSPGARGFTLFRAYAGAILGPLLVFWQNDLGTAIMMSIVQLCYCGSLILLLQGKTRTWKLITAIGVYVIFCFGILACGMTGLLLARIPLK